MNTKPADLKLEASNTAYILLSILAAVTMLVYAEEYIIPFILALIIWFIIHEIRENLQMIPYVKEKVPLWVQSAIGFLIINAVIFLIVELLIVSVSDLSTSIALYEANLDKSLLQINAMAGMDVTSQLYEFIENIEFTKLFSAVLDYTTVLLGDAFLILIYVLFLLIEETVFPYKLKALFDSEKKQKNTVALLNKMDHSISRYLTLKTIVSLITGVLSYFALLIFGIDGAVFWALLIFVLNYIPTVGSLIATVFPALFAILQFGEFGPALYILLSVGLIQVIVGNIIEPKLMGNSLNISSLVVILSLTIWGAIWGIMGMILSVPITVMMIVVCEEIPQLRSIAILLSEKGQLNALNQD